MPAPPLGSKLAASPPGGDRGARTLPDGWAWGTLSARCTQREGPGGGAAPRKKGKRAGRGGGGGARAAGASSLLHCRGAIFPRLRAAGLRGGGSGQPRPPPPGHRLPAGPLHQPAGSSSHRLAHMRHPRPPPNRGVPQAPQPGFAALPGERPRVPCSKSGCSPLAPAQSGDATGPLACDECLVVKEISLPEPLAEPTPRQSRRPCRTYAALPVDPSSLPQQEGGGQS